MAPPLMIPDLIVLATVGPSRTAPKKLSTPAMRTACLKVIAFAPTAVAMEFATSFAPMLHAM